VAKLSVVLSQYFQVSLNADQFDMRIYYRLLQVRRELESFYQRPHFDYGPDQRIRYTPTLSSRSLANGVNERTEYLKGITSMEYREQRHGYGSRYWTLVIEQYVEPHCVTCDIRSIRPE
jgi:hypothetical protein